MTARGTRLGTHSLTCGPTMRYVEILASAGAYFPVVKAVDDCNWLPEVTDITGPHTIPLGRVHSDIEHADAVMNPAADLDEAAQALMALIFKKVDDNPRLLDIGMYWEVVNEPVTDPKDLDTVRRLAELMMRCIDRAEGLKLALLSFSPGTPEWDAMVALVDSGLFQKMQEGGHIVALHEGVLHTTDPIELWWEHLIPGAPHVEGAGAMCFRYRYLYRLLQDRGLVVPLVVSEWGNGPVRGAFSPDEMLRRVNWYDEEGNRDWWLWAYLPFTLGPLGPEWQTWNWATYYEERLLDWMIANKDRKNASPPGTPPPPPDPGLCPGQARTRYHKDTVLLPPGADSLWARCATIATWGRGEPKTITASADDAGIGGGLASNMVRLVNWDEWPDDPLDFFEQHYPGTILDMSVLARTPWEMAVKLCPPLRADGPQWGDVAMDDPRWADDDLGEEPGGETIGRAGCLLLGFCYALREAYGRDLLPNQLNQLLALEGTPFVDDDLLINWHRAVAMFPVFDDSIKVNRSYTAAELRERLDAGWLIVLRVQGGAHFVYLAEVLGDDGLEVRDPIGARVYAINPTEVSGIRAARLADVPPPPPPPPPSSPAEVLVGFHDDPPDVADNALSWLLAADLPGLIVYPVYMGDGGPRQFDFSVAEAAGIQVWLNIRYSWSTDAGGGGTLPIADRWVDFAEDVVETVLQAKGVQGFSIANEYNNPREWPHGMALSPAYVIMVYNYIRERVEEVDGVWLAPGPADPFYGPGSDCGWWFEQVWGNITGAEYVPLHGYIRGPVADLCWSEDMFGNDPLRWQYLNYLGCCQTLLSRLPEQYQRLPVVIEEFNHLWRTVEPDFGWVTDNRAAEVVRAAVARAEEWNAAVPVWANPIIGLALYRWQFDAWVLKDNQVVKDAVTDLLRRGS